MRGRSADTRAATARPAIGGEQFSRLTIDTTGLPKDMELAWLCETCDGKPSENLEFNLRHRGYVPATTAMLPGEKPFALPGRVIPEDGLIRKGGLIACVRPKSVGDAERAAQQAQAFENVQAAQRIPTDGKNFKDSSAISERSDTGALFQE